MGGAARLIAASLAAIAVACLALRGDRGERPPHERIDVPSVAACGRCHADVYREWSQSLHARAWTNENVLRATRNFERESCRACHSPLPALATGLDRAPDYREFNQEDGVHCLSCHGLPDGVAATRTIEGAPCRPRAEPRLGLAEFCFPCHEPTHQAFSEYAVSNARRDGVRCMDCHMPEREDGSGRSHGPHGGMNPEFVKLALDWDCRIENDELVVRLENETGHKFPGEIPSRSFLLKVDFGEAGSETVLLRKPHKQEDREDDRLLPDEVRILRFALPENVEDVRVRLLFLPLPLLPEEHAFVLGEWSSG